MHVDTLFKVDKAKIQAASQWQPPTSVGAFRCFLGLMGYYRMFIKDYGLTAAPLTRMLRKNALVWTEESSHSFEALKAAMTSTLVLAYKISRRSSSWNVTHHKQSWGCPSSDRVPHCLL